MKIPDGSIRIRDVNDDAKVQIILFDAPFIFYLCVAGLIMIQYLL